MATTFQQTQFFDFVNSSINMNTNLRALFSESHPSVGTPPSLVSLCATQVNGLIVNPINFEGILTLAGQEKLLSSAGGFRRWLELRPMVGDQAINLNHIDLFRRLSTEQRNIESEDAFFTELFNDTFLRANSQQKNTLIQRKRSCHPIQEGAHYRLQDVVEKTIAVVSAILSNPVFQLVVGISLYIYSFILIHRINNFIIPIITKLAFKIPLLESITNYKWTIYLLLFPILTTISLIFPRAARRASIVIDKVLFFPFHIRLAAYKLGFNASHSVVTSFPTIGNRMAALRTRWTDLRLGREVVEARNDWVQMALAHRNINRVVPTAA